LSYFADTQLCNRNTSGNLPFLLWLVSRSLPFCFATPFSLWANLFPMAGVFSCFKEVSLPIEEPSVSRNLLWQHQIVVAAKRRICHEYLFRSRAFSSLGRGGFYGVAFFFFSKVPPFFHPGFPNVPERWKYESPSSKDTGTSRHLQSHMWLRGPFSHRLASMESRQQTLFWVGFSRYPTSPNL